MLYWILDLDPNFNWLLIWTALDFSCCHPYHPFIVYFHLPSSSLSVNSSPELMLSVVLPDLEIKHILSYLILSLNRYVPILSAPQNWLNICIRVNIHCELTNGNCIFIDLGSMINVSLITGRFRLLSTEKHMRHISLHIKTKDQYEYKNTLKSTVKYLI